MASSIGVVDIVDSCLAARKKFLRSIGFDRPPEGYGCCCVFRIALEYDTNCPMQRSVCSAAVARCAGPPASAPPTPAYVLRDPPPPVQWSLISRGKHHLLSAMYIRTLRRSIIPQSFTQLLQRTCIASQSFRMASTLPRIPVFEAIASHDPKSTAVIHSKSGRRFTYGELLRDVADSRNSIRHSAGEQRIEGERVAFLVENGYDYVGAKQAVCGS